MIPNGKIYDTEHKNDQQKCGGRMVLVEMYSKKKAVCVDLYLCVLFPA